MFSQAVTQRCSSKRVFCKHTADLHQNINAKVWFQNSCIATLFTSHFHMCVLLYISNNYAISRREKSKPSKHSSWWRCLEDVFGLRLQKTSSRRLDQEEYIRLTHSLQKTSSRRLHQDQHIRLGHTSSKRPQDIFKTSSRYFENVFKTSSRHLQDVFKTYYQINMFLVTQF